MPPKTKQPNENYAFRETLLLEHRFQQGIFSTECDLP